MRLSATLKGLAPWSAMVATEGGKVPELSRGAVTFTAGAAPGTAFARLTRHSRPSPQLATLAQVICVLEAAETLQPVARYAVSRPGGP